MDKSFRLPVRRVVVEPDESLDTAAWPATIPAVRRLLGGGRLDPGPATVLVGENGSGTSTAVEAVAMAFGMNPEGGSTLARTISRTSESPLHRSLRVEPRAATSCVTWGERSTACRWATWLEISIVVDQLVATNRRNTRVPNSSDSIGTRSSTPWNMPEKSRSAGSRSGAKP